MVIYSRGNNSQQRARHSAAVCRRGHVETSHLEERNGDIPVRCQDCGSKILTKCPSCSAPITGQFTHVRGGYTPPEFCTNCGTPMPWSSRQARLYQLENILDEQPELSEADRLTIHEHINELSKTDISEEQQSKHWKTIQSLSPTIIEAGKEIIVSVTTALIQKQLGIG